MAGGDVLLLPGKQARFGLHTHIHTQTRTSTHEKYDLSRSANSSFPLNSGVTRMSPGHMDANPQSGQ